MSRSPTSRFGRPDKEILLLVVMVGCAAWMFFWTATLGGAPCFLRRPDGYYNLQAAGFLSGHLHAAIDPHPGLLALADPYDPVANGAVPRARHDVLEGQVLPLFWASADPTRDNPLQAFERSRRAVSSRWKNTAGAEGG